MSNSPEYNAFLDCISELRLAVKASPLSLSSDLVAARLISPEKEESLRNRSKDDVDRAADLTSLLLDKIQQDPKKYYGMFVEVLKKDEDQYETVLQLLEQKYRLRTKEGGPSLSEDRGNGQIVKLKVVAAESGGVQPHKPMLADSSSQTPCLVSNGSTILHQPHLAFGALCGCKVCTSDLGCPKPITAESTFPLLDHMDGLDRIKKEDLHTRLKKETKEIMMQFYNLLSKFFNSLKDRHFPVDDLKTHLMALDAFDDDDDDQHQSVFQEEAEKLDRASTINEVFKIIKVFCSFFNYDLIEHLIDVAGSDKDKALFQTYKDKFTEYAKRRIYECPPKTAMCSPQHCDMYIKLESRFSKKLSLDELREFRLTICKLLKVSQYVLRLCCIEKGCIRLTFQIPLFVKQHLFPLTSEQERALIQLEVLHLICGNYEYPIEGKPLSSDSHTHSSVSAKSCLDCNSNTGEVPLVCEAHFVCSDCLVKRTESIAHSGDLLACNACNQVTRSSKSNKVDTYRDAVLQKQHTDAKDKTGEHQPQQKPQKPPQPPNGIWIFVNDSNIWIEAKKLQSKQKMFKTSEDHRVRMDMGKLADVLARGRPVRQGKLYGSEPPKIDTVWQKIREQGWEVDTSQRTTFKHGKEKQIITKFVVDVVSLAEKVPPEKRSSIILVSGDASIIPAIEKVVEADGWNVEIYMWSHATSKQIQQLQSKHRDRVTVSSLDPYLGDVTFTSMRFDSSNKNFLEMAKKSSVVFTVDPDSNSFPNHIPTDQWMSRLEELAQWPCQYYWYNHPQTEQKNKLVVVFKQDSKSGLFNVATFLAKVTSGTKYQIPSVVRAQSFLDFMATDQLDRLGGDFEQIGQFDQYDVIQLDSVYVTNSNAQVTKWNPHLITS